MKTKNPIAGGLVEVARHLSDVRGRRIVEQVAFRRAISRAYYAVFHTLCQISCDGLGVWTGAADEIELAYRHLEHNKARQIVTSSEVQTLHENFPGIGRALVELRRLREDADYSQPGRLGGTQKLLTRTETRTLIDLAEEAVRLLGDLPANIRRKLAIMLAVRSSRRQVSQVSS